MTGSGLAIDDATRGPCRRLEVGAFLLFLAIYSLSGPGRIDMIDGQYRFEVSWNLVEMGRPIVRDVFLPARTGLDGARYSYYSPAASVAAMPLVWLGFVFGGEDGELARFLFSFTTAIFAAATLALLLHWWLRLGVSPRKALAWTGVVGLASLLWPQATSTFDQAQHAFFVLAGAYAGARASEDHHAARWALLSGLLVGILVLYQPPYVVLGPLLALSLVGTARPIRLRVALPRFALFGVPFAVCIGAECLYNWARFGSIFDLGGWPGPAWGNPLTGVPGLLVSPGKGVLWFSPVIILQLWALRPLWRLKPILAMTVIAMATAHFAFISILSFYGGDWAWGPRYLVVTTPLLAIGLPFLHLGSKARRWVARTIVGVGLLVQVAGLSMDHQGFFFAHALPDWFWTDQTFNFRHSQLSYRMIELRNLFAGVRADSSVSFRPGPYPTLPTYCIFGVIPRMISPQWMKTYPVFYLPRPWPLWMPHLPPGKQPVPPLRAAALFALMGVAGALLIRRGLRNGRIAEPDDGVAQR